MTTLKYAVMILFGVGPRLLRIVQMKRAHILPMDEAGGESPPPFTVRGPTGDGGWRYPRQSTEGTIDLEQ